MNTLELHKMLKMRTYPSVMCPLATKTTNFILTDRYVHITSSYMIIDDRINGTIKLAVPLVDITMLTGDNFTLEMWEIYTKQRILKTK